MDIINLLNEKSFLGQEFLTWLWWMSDEGRDFTLPDGRNLTIALGERLSLSPIMGQEGNRVASSGKDKGLAEAREALRQGKLVDNLRLVFLIDGEEYWLTLDSFTLTPRSIRLPQSADKEEEGLDADAQALERISLMESLLKAHDFLFQTYLQTRLQQQGHWPALAGWMNA